jgi:hypothetical protein
MTRAIQQQIILLKGEGVKSYSDGTVTTTDVAGEKLSLSLDASLSNIQSQGSSGCGPLVAMLLLGGVDSSVALHLLLRLNYNNTAFYLRIWLKAKLVPFRRVPLGGGFESMPSCVRACRECALGYGQFGG